MSRESAPALRLVHPDGGPAPTVLRRSDMASPMGRLREDVASENKEAEQLSASDARWVFACRVAGGIEGGRAGVLRPEVRERLMSQAQLLGLRAFDASLVIAIVQDTARVGGAPLDDTVADRLKLVRAPIAAKRAAVWPLILAASALGMTIMMLLMAWMGQG